MTPQPIGILHPGEMGISIAASLIAVRRERRIESRKAVAESE